MTTLLYIFVFTTWGTAIASWIFALLIYVGKQSIIIRDKSLELDQKIAFVNQVNAISRMSSNTGIASIKKRPEQINNKIQQLMKSSPNHPEVSEIDSSDEILGVRFEAENYPPVFGDEDE